MITSLSYCISLIFTGFWSFCPAIFYNISNIFLTKADYFLHYYCLMFLFVSSFFLVSIFFTYFVYFNYNLIVNLSITPMELSWRDFILSQPIFSTGRFLMLFLLCIMYPPLLWHDGALYPLLPFRPSPFFLTNVKNWNHVWYESTGGQDTPVKHSPNYAPPSNSDGVNEIPIQENPQAGSSGSDLPENSPFGKPWAWKPGKPGEPAPIIFTLPNPAHPDILLHPIKPENVEATIQQLELVVRKRPRKITWRTFETFTIPKTIFFYVVFVTGVVWTTTVLVFIFNKAWGIRMLHPRHPAHYPNRPTPPTV